MTRSIALSVAFFALAALLVSDRKWAHAAIPTCTTNTQAVKKDCNLDPVGVKCEVQE